MKPTTEFTDAQKKALELYLHVDSDYKAPSFVQLSVDMVNAGFSASSSTLQRWAKSCDFEAYLEQHINALVASDEEKSKALQAAAGEMNYKKTLMTLEENAELLHGSHAVLKLLVEQISFRAKSGRAITKDDAKLMIQLYNITSAREDRLHDRQAGLDAVDKITKADLLKQFAGTGIDIEQLANDDAIDIEIEE